MYADGAILSSFIDHAFAAEEGVGGGVSAAEVLVEDFWVLAAAFG